MNHATIKDTNNPFDFVYVVKFELLIPSYYN